MEDEKTCFLKKRGIQTVQQQPKHMTEPGSSQSNACQHDSQRTLPRSQMHNLAPGYGGGGGASCVITIQMAGNGVVDCALSL